MTKQFAQRETDEPDIANLQLTFWRLAVEQFNRIADKWKEFAVEDNNEVLDTEVLDTEVLDTDDDYVANDFVIDAAVALVLAGTSLTELIGKNVASEGTKTPHLRPAYSVVMESDVPPKVEEFFQIYDAVRHFGPAKHDTVAEISEKKLCEYLTTAQSVWIDILNKLDSHVGSDFKQSFVFED